MTDPHITIPDEDPIIQYTVTSSDDTFTFPFSYFTDADILVYDGEDLIASADYTVTGNAGTTGGYDGGSILLDTPVENTVITILRSVAIARTTDFPVSGPFNITALNTQLDKIFAIQQQNETKIARAIHIPDTDDTSITTDLPAAADRAGKACIFDEDGNVTVSTDDYEDQAIATAADAAAAAASAAAALVSENNASDSEDAAAASAAAAAASASSASTSASTATTQASNASSSATSAASSASSASTSASTATTQATNAATSASSASTSASTATTQATNAATSASSASTSASNAATSATSAASSASSASSSATSAAASAASAASTLASALWRGMHRLTSADSPYTVVSGDNGKLLLCDTSSGAITINAPQISGLTLPFNIGIQLDAGSSSVTIARGGTDTFDGATSLSIGTTGAGYELLADTTPSPDEWEVIAIGAQTGNRSVDKFSGTGAQTAFTLSVDPGTVNNVDVFISGVSQSPTTDYTVSGTTLTFSTAPASGTNNIVVKYGTTVSIGVPGDATVTEAKLSLSDNTTANASTSAHGFLKKLSNSAQDFMDGAGNWTTAIAKVLTGYTKGAGTVASTDSILQAIQKLDGNDDLKAPLASPTFTGTPAAPTASVGTNTTQIATTAFVLANAPAAGLTTIASGNCATGSPTVIDITSIPATYRELILYINGASNSVATRALRVSCDTGSGLGNAANLATWTLINNATPAAGGGGGGVAGTMWTDVTQTAAQTSSCVLRFPAYQSGPIKMYSGNIQLAQTAGADWNASGTNQITIQGVLVNASSVARTGAIVGIRITWDNVATGVFDGGTYALYGVN